MLVLPILVLPTDKQIECCGYMGWEYLGDGLFTNNKEELGYFTKNGFYKESEE